MGRLDALDLSVKLSAEEEAERLEAAQKRLLALRLVLGGQVGDREIGPRAGGIQRLGAGRELLAQFALDPRFWPALPGWGGMAVFDRSWYGRVLVERVEKLATREQWGRAYDEINGHERSLTSEGTILVKFFLHISDGEQLKRFQARERDPLKSWKLTDEDWRNRKKRKQYTAAIEDMLEFTDKPGAPWYLVEGDSKKWARVKVLETTNSVIEAGIRAHGIDPPTSSFAL